MLNAKSIDKGKFWVVHKNNIKVGQIKKISDNNIEVTINGMATKFDSLKSLKESGLFSFTDFPIPKPSLSKEVHGYPSNVLAYNAVWNLEYDLPLYTKTKKSKSWYAAGYYEVNINENWEKQFCPKFILLQRNKFKGPYKNDSH